MFYIKAGNFYYAGFDKIKEDQLYSSGVASAMKFETLEELDAEVALYNLSGYSVGVDK